jgi:hypothetical protein
MKVGDYVEFATYHPAYRWVTKHRRGIILKIRINGNRRLYTITDGKQSFEHLGGGQIRKILSPS